MCEARKRPWRPGPVGLVAGGICVAGFALLRVEMDKDDEREAVVA